MRTVRILRPTVGDGGRVLGTDEVVDLAEAEARDLCARGRAEPVVAPLDVAAPVPQYADPAPTRARRGR